MQHQTREPELHSQNAIDAVDKSEDHNSRNSEQGVVILVMPARTTNKLTVSNQCGWKTLCLIVTNIKHTKKTVSCFQTVQHRTVKKSWPSNYKTCIISVTMRNSLSGCYQVQTKTSAGGVKKLILKEVIYSMLLPLMMESGQDVPTSPVVCVM